MVRILVTVVVASIVGFALGQAQVRWSSQSVPEHLRLAEHSASVAAGAMRTEIYSGIPKIELPNGNSFNFGQMRHGSSMAHTFVIKNVGEGQLNLEKKGSTCKCTVGELTESVLKPGEETKITLTWRAQSVSPRFGQSATFKTNDPANTELQFVIEGSVIDSFVFEPTQIDLGDFAPDSSVSREFMVYCYSDDDVELSRLVWSNPSTQKFVSLQHSPVAVDPNGKHPKATKAYAAKLEVEPGMPIGLVSSKISFLTNHGDEIDMLEMPVNGRVVSEISVIGGSHFSSDNNILDIGNLQSGQEFSTSIWIKLNGPLQDDFELTIDQVDADGSLNVRIGEPKFVGKSKMIPVHFEVPKDAKEAYYPGTKKGTFAKVLIKSNSNKLPEFPVHVRLVVAN